MEIATAILSFIIQNKVELTGTVLILGRAYKALQNGGGLKGVYHSIMFGTNTPKPTEQPK